MSQYNVGAPMERVAIDVLGPLPLSTSGNKYLLIAADYFTVQPTGNQEDENHPTPPTIGWHGGKDELDPGSPTGHIHRTPPTRLG